ncbi:MAG TPA: chemotaxis-specific protein-glutamate methyltransferase CheB [Methylotenera sp.]|nr:chemotaxis-specific protein-glutamate methyltransferase CheB [Methylotenera sp.]
MVDGRIKVLVADDSTVTRMFLVHLLESDPRIRVVGAVSDGQAALDFVIESKPDVVLMDINMPKLDGFEATRRIMETEAVPIIICSAAANTKDMDIAFRAMEAGAIACIEKPIGREHGDFEALAAHLLETVRLMSEVKVVRRSGRTRTTPLQKAELQAPVEIKVIGVGASTGGPPVLQTILAALPKDFSVPLLVVQHIARGFVTGMADWLNQTTSLQVRIASHGVYPESGHVYLAPDDFHMGVGVGGEIILTRQEPENHLRPSVAFLFRSLAAVHGPNALGVLLTGMGKDGAVELKAMKDRGAITIAQDKESSVVHGMPGVAIALGGATHVLSPDKIANALTTLINHRAGVSRSRGYEFK